jgi:hypothetical protein
MYIIDVYRFHKRSLTIKPQIRILQNSFQKYSQILQD